VYQRQGSSEAEEFYTSYCSAQILLADQIYGSRIIIERLNQKCRSDARVHEYTTDLDAEDLCMLRRQIAQVRAARRRKRHNMRPSAVARWVLRVFDL
jgi:hypothetical protein